MFEQILSTSWGQVFDSLLSSEFKESSGSDYYCTYKKKYLKIFKRFYPILMKKKMIQELVEISFNLK